MRIHAPGMGLLVARGERSKLGRRGGPEPEGAVDMNPGTRGPSVGHQRMKGIKGAGIHVARLEQQERSIIEGWEGFPMQPALIIHRHPLDLVTPEPQECQSLQRRSVEMGAGHHTQRWSPREALGVDVIALALKKAPASRSEPRHQSQGTAAEEARGYGVRQPEELLKPALHHRF